MMTGRGAPSSRESLGSRRGWGERVCHYAPFSAQKKKPEGAGDRGIGVGRGERVSSKANWESDCSDKSEVRRAAESNGEGGVVACLVAIQFQLDGRYVY